MPRYVLLRHELPPGSGRASHWDLMLEREGVLLTWAMEELPAAWLAQLRLPSHSAKEKVAAQRLKDHRLAYLDYEGPLSGNRGNATRVATGEFQFIEDTADKLEAILTGDLTGQLLLTLCKIESTEWLLQILDDVGKPKGFTSEGERSIDF